MESGGRPSLHEKVEERLGHGRRRALTWLAGAIAIGLAGAALWLLRETGSRPRLGAPESVYERGRTPAAPGKQEADGAKAQRPATEVAGTDPGGQRSGQTEDRFALELDYNSMLDIIGILTNKYGVRVCFEEMDFDPQKDRISLGQRIASLGRLSAERELSPRESLLLESAQRALRDGAAQTKVWDIERQRFSGHFAAQTVEELLGALTATSPYALTSRNGTCVVFPREGSLLGYHVALETRGKTLDDVTGEIAAQAPLGLQIVRAGFVRAHDTETPAGKAVVARLDLRGVPARDALCRAVEAAGEDVVWSLNGFKGQRTLNLSRVPRGYPR